MVKSYASSASCPTAHRLQPTIFIVSKRDSINHCPFFGVRLCHPHRINSGPFFFRVPDFSFPHHTYKTPCHLAPRRASTARMHTSNLPPSPTSCIQGGPLPRAPAQVVIIPRPCSETWNGPMVQKSSHTQSEQIINIPFASPPIHAIFSS